jgi:hypothetical protein
MARHYNTHPGAGPNSHGGGVNDGKFLKKNADCEQSLTGTVARDLQAQKATGKAVLRGDNVIRVAARVREGWEPRIFRYICLPDTVDPRGPKTK